MGCMYEFDLDFMYEFEEKPSSGVGKLWISTALNKLPNERLSDKELFTLYRAESRLGPTQQFHFNDIMACFFQDLAQASPGMISEKHTWKHFIKLLQKHRGPVLDPM